MAIARVEFAGKSQVERLIREISPCEMHQVSQCKFLPSWAPSCANCHQIAAKCWLLVAILSDQQIHTILCVYLYEV